MGEVTALKNLYDNIDYEKRETNFNSTTYNNVKINNYAMQNIPA